MVHRKDLILIFILTLPLHAMAVKYGPFQISPSATTEIQIYDATCRNVANSSATRYMVPANSAAEWTAFNTNIPGALTVSVVACTTPAVAYVQTSEQQITTNNTTVATPAFGAAPVAGNFIVCGIIYSSSTLTITGVADNKGNTYSSVTPGSRLRGVGGLAAYTLEVWYKENIAGGAGLVVTATLSGNNNYKDITCQEYSGVVTSGSLDQVFSADPNTATSPATLGPFTTSYNKALIYVHAMVLGSGGVGAGFASRSTFDGNLVEDKFATPAGGYTATFTVTGVWAAPAVTFKSQ